VLAAALAGAVLSAPVHAAEPDVWLDSDLAASAVAAASAGKTVPVWYRAMALGGAPAPRTVTAVIDPSQAKAVTLTLAGPTPGCSVARAVITCERPATETFNPDGDLRVRLTAAPGAQPGDQGDIAITTFAAGAQPSTRTFPVTVTAPGPDLSVGRVNLTGKPGGTVTTRPVIRNNGSQTAKTIVLTVNGGSFVAFTAKHRNCHYRHDDYGFDSAVCVLENVNLAPCQTLTYSAATPLGVRIGRNIPGQLRITRNDPPGQHYTTYASYSVDAFDAVPTDDERLSWPLGDGPALTFDRATGCHPTALTQDADPRDDWGIANILITPDNPTDMAASGTTVRGRPGDVVTFSLGIANQGPADVSATPDAKGGDLKDPYNAGFRFTVPAGLEILEVTQPNGFGYQNWYEETVAGVKNYVVVAFSLPGGAQYATTFTARITSSAPAAGTVTAQGGVRDPHRADNVAQVLLNPR
jgi:hypothetical protein